LALRKQRHAQSGRTLAHPQRIVALRVRGEVLRTHAQRVRPGSRDHRSERWAVRIVALDAPQPPLRALARVPVAVGAAVRAVLPVTIHRPVALRAQQLRLVPGDLPAVVVDKGVPVRAVMAVEAAGVDPVLQMDFAMLGQRPVRLQGRRDDPMAVAAAVGKHALRVPRLQARLAHRRAVGGPLGYGHRAGIRRHEGPRSQRERSRKHQQDGGDPVHGHAGGPASQIVCHDPRTPQRADLRIPSTDRPIYRRAAQHRPSSPPLRPLPQAPRPGATHDAHHLTRPPPGRVQRRRRFSHALGAATDLPSHEANDGPRGVHPVTCRPTHALRARHPGAARPAT